MQSRVHTKFGNERQSVASPLSELHTCDTAGKVLIFGNLID